MPLANGTANCCVFSSNDSTVAAGGGSAFALCVFPWRGSWPSPPTWWLVVWHLTLGLLQAGWRSSVHDVFCKGAGRSWGSCLSSWPHHLLPLLTLHGHGQKSASPPAPYNGPLRPGKQRQATGDHTACRFGWAGCPACLSVSLTADLEKKRRHGQTSSTCMFAATTPIRRLQAHALPSARMCMCCSSFAALCCFVLLMIPPRQKRTSSDILFLVLLFATLAARRIPPRSTYCVKHLPPNCVKSRPPSPW